MQPDLSETFSINNYFLKVYVLIINLRKVKKNANSLFRFCFAFFLSLKVFNVNLFLNEKMFYIPLSYFLIILIIAN